MDARCNATIGNKAQNWLPISGNFFREKTAISWKKK